MEQKEKVIVALSVDRDKVMGLWKKALLSYQESISASDKKKKIEHDNDQRKYRNKIMDIAMKTYNIQDPTTKKKKWVSFSFSEFWDYLYWWLKVVLGGSEKWNEMEDYHHTLMRRFRNDK